LHRPTRHRDVSRSQRLRFEVNPSTTKAVWMFWAADIGSGEWSKVSFVSCVVFVYLQIIANQCTNENAYLIHKISTCFISMPRLVFNWCVLVLVMFGAFDEARPVLCLSEKTEDFMMMWWGQYSWWLFCDLWVPLGNSKKSWQSFCRNFHG
jgi:hypothetical protein